MERNVIGRMFRASRKRDPVEVFSAERMRTFGEVGDTTEWFFRVRSGNGQIVAQSQAYTTKYHAEAGAAALKRLMQDHRPKAAAQQIQVHGE